MYHTTEVIHPLDYTAEFMKNEKGFPESTPMQDYFRGKTIFLLGGTGFLGQLFLQKLLRCKVKCIYILMRSKRGISAEDRLKDVISGKLFAKLISQNKKLFRRIRIIEGDLIEPNLGIAENDINELVENVEIVIHSAADVRFDEALLKLMLINVRGTRDLIRMAEKMKKLEAFAYISTAYSHCYRNNLDEKFYPAPEDPEFMIKFAEKYWGTSKEPLEVIQDLIIKPWPNTYTYSKSLTEEVVRRAGTKLPICLVRPTIIISTHEDPIPGWCNNVYGLNGVLVACGMGVLRLMPLKRNMRGDVVCADFVTNSTLAALWTTYEDRKLQYQIPEGEPEIYHVTISQDIPISWGTISEEARKTFAEVPAKRMLWAHRPNTTTCPFMWKLLIFYYHVVPAFIFDAVAKLLGKKMRLLPIYRKVQRFMAALRYFMNNEYCFTNTNMKRVLARMTKEDQEYFPSDVKRMVWSEFVYHYVIGLKIYIGFERMEDAETGKKVYKRLTILHYFVLIFYYGIHLCVFYKILQFYNIIDYWKNTAIDTFDYFVN